MKVKSKMHIVQCTLWVIWSWNARQKNCSPQGFTNLSNWSKDSFAVFGLIHPNQNIPRLGTVCICEIHVATILLNFETVIK